MEKRAIRTCWWICTLLKHRDNFSRVVYIHTESVFVCIIHHKYNPGPLILVDVGAQAGSSCDANSITIKDAVSGSVQCQVCRKCPSGEGLSVSCGDEISSRTPIVCKPCVLGETYSSEPGPAKIATTAGRIAWPPKRAHWRRRPSAENVKLGHTLSPCWACVSRVPSVVTTARTLSSLSVKYPEYPQISSAVLRDQPSATKSRLLRVSLQRSQL